MRVRTSEGPAFDACAASRLLELYDLPADVPLSGASAGALAVVLGRCGVDPSTAHTLAFSLADAAGVFRNPMGLCGKWGRLVQQWLDVLLPSDAAQRASGGCRVAVTRFAPWPRADAIEHFRTRDEVLGALMASTHIPFFMDCRLLSRRVQPAAADGGLLAWVGLRSGLSLLVPNAAGVAGAVELSHRRDDVFLDACKRNGWMAIRTKGTECFACFGAAWVEREAERGADGAFGALEPFRRGAQLARAAAAAPPVRSRSVGKRRPTRLSRSPKRLLCD